MFHAVKIFIFILDSSPKPDLFCGKMLLAHHDTSTVRNGVLNMEFWLTDIRRSVIYILAY